MDLGAHICGYRMPANDLKSFMVVSNPRQLLMTLRAAPHGAVMVRFELAGLLYLRLCREQGHVRLRVEWYIATP
jgi:hypothetical protein